MKFLKVNGERVAATCDTCGHRAFRPEPIYRYGNKVLCEECLKEITALRWWDMEDNEWLTAAYTN